MALHQFLGILAGETDGREHRREQPRVEERERERGQRACTRESVASRAREVETRCA